ncbi:MAG: FtsL-like putative cell division protein [Bacteroidia bacterium]
MTKNAIKEQQKETPEPKRKSSGRNIVTNNVVTRNVGSVLTGAFLSKERALKAVPFIFFVTFILLLYIANGYYAEGQIRKHSKLKYELKDLQSEYIISKSELSALSLQSAVTERLKATGVKESNAEPPRKILVRTKTKPSN